MKKFFFFVVFFLGYLAIAEFLLNLVPFTGEWHGTITCFIIIALLSMITMMKFHIK